MCRTNITATCEKILPFNSIDIFKYTNIAGADDKRKNNYVNKVKQFIDDPRFDVNVKDPKTYRSILYTLTSNNAYYFYDYIEKLLQSPNIVIDENIISLLTSRYITDERIIKLFKKNKQAKKLLRPFI